MANVYRCPFHVTACPGGCAERGWCWAEGDHDAQRVTELTCGPTHAHLRDKAGLEWDGVEP